MPASAKRRQTDHAGRAQAMELIIATLMRCWCRDPDHPTQDEMRQVFDEIRDLHEAFARDER